MADMITGRNAVLEALKSDREIEKLIVAKGAEGSIRKITGMAKDKNNTDPVSGKSGARSYSGQEQSSGRYCPGVGVYLLHAG